MRAPPSEALPIVLIVGAVFLAFALFAATLVWRAVAATARPYRLRAKLRARSADARDGAAPRPGSLLARLAPALTHVEARRRVLLARGNLRALAACVAVLAVVAFVPRAWTYGLLIVPATLLGALLLRRTPPASYRDEAARVALTALAAAFGNGTRFVRHGGRATAPAEDLHGLLAAGPRALASASAGANVMRWRAGSAVTGKVGAADFWFGDVAPSLEPADVHAEDLPRWKVALGGRAGEGGRVLFVLSWDAWDFPTMLLATRGPFPARLTLGFGSAFETFTPGDDGLAEAVDAFALDPAAARACLDAPGLARHLLAVLVARNDVSLVLEARRLCVLALHDTSTAAFGFSLDDPLLDTRWGFGGFVELVEAVFALARALPRAGAGAGE